MLNISEIFCSIQGESTYTGLPCIFIRLAGCNLRCDYCDSTYSYKSKITLSFDEIISKIKEFEPVRLIEITGGEPLLQNEVHELIDILEENNFVILLETNGTLLLDKIPKYVTKIVDVKCPGSGEKNSFLMENLEYIDIEKDELKFVLTDNYDYNWAKDFIMKNKLKGYEILLSPVSEKLKPHDLAKWIIDDKLPVRLQLQLHKIIWDKDKRGV